VCQFRSPESTRFLKLTYERWNRFRDDRQVKPERFVPGIEDVQVNHIREGRTVFPVNLPMAGEPRYCIESLVLGHFIVLEFVRRAWARTDNAHLAPKHIEKLRQFIQTCRAKDSAPRNQTGVPDRIELRHPSIGLH